MHSAARSLFAGLLLAAGTLPVSAVFAQDTQSPKGPQGVKP
ncbi:hypothetical protein [Roseateles sp.]